MRTIRKIISFFLLLIATQFSFAQDQKPPVRVEGRVTNFVSQASVGGANIEVYKNGQLIETKTTSSSGKYKISDLQLDNKYKLVFNASGMVPRFVEIDLTGIPNEDVYTKGWDIPVDIPLVERLPNIDFSTVEPKRSSIIKHNKSTGDLDWNMGEIEWYRKKLEELLKKIEAEKKKQEEEKAAQEKKFNDAMLAADAAMKANDYETAIKKYEEAKSIKPEAATDVIKKLEIAQQKYKEFQGAAVLQKEYDAFMKAGDDKFKTKDYDNAIASYKQALTKKPNDALANQKIKDAENAKKADVDKTYNDALVKADKAFKEKDYSQAKNFYKEAKTLKPSETLPDQKIKEIDDFIKKDMENEAKYNDLIANAGKNVLANKFDEAIVQYNEALKLRPGDTEATNGLSSAKKAKDAAASEAANKAAKEKEFNDLVARGDKEFQAKNYETAIKTYNDALLKFDNPDVKKKKFDAEEAYKKYQADQAAKLEADKRKADFDKFMADGNSSFTAKDFDKAIGNYESAKATGVNNAEADKKITDAKNAKVAAEKDAQAKADADKKKADFDKFIADGDTKVTGKLFDDAVAAYTMALNLKIDDAAANKKIVEAKAAKSVWEKEQADKALAEANAKKKTEFDGIILAGDAKVSSKEFEAAIIEYKKALALKVDDVTATAKIKSATDAKTIWEKEQADKALAEANAKKKTEFDGIILAGDAKVSSKEFEAAIIEYKKALALKVDDVTATAKIKSATDAKTIWEKEQADKALADANAKKKTEFDAMISGGEAKLSTKEFDAAITEFKKALAMKVDDALANDKIKSATEAKTLWEKEQADKALADANAKKKSEFDGFIASGNTKQSSKEFDKAIEEYKKALALKVDDASANSKIKEATDAKYAYEKELASKADLASKKKLYDETIAKAQKDFDAGEFQAAIDKYNTALTFVPDDAFAKSQIEKANQKLDERKKEAEALLQKLLDQADKDFAAEKYADAKGYYERYAKQRPDNTYAKERIIECEKRIKEKELTDANAKKKSEFDAIIAAGDSKVTAKDFDKGIEEYKKALLTKFDDATANTKIKEATDAKTAYQKELADKSLADAEAKKKKDFENAIAAGDVKVESKEFDKAIEDYKKALIFKIDDALANQKIADATTLKEQWLKDQQTQADAAKNKKLYDDIIAKAQKDFDGGDFKAAIDKYTTALTYIPDDSFAKGQIEKANQKLDERAKEAEALLQKLLDQADKDYAAENYADAKGYYERYLKQRPDNAYVKGKIAECELKLKEKEASAAEKAKIEALYKDFMMKGDVAFKGNKFDDAIAAYDGALGVKGGDADATAKKAQAIKAKQEAANALSTAVAKKKYDEIIKKANAFFDGGDFTASITEYNNALVVIPNDEFAKKRIELANERIDAKKKEVEAMLAKLLSAADKEFSDKNYADAKSYYERYLKQRPDNTYAQNQIKECERFLLELANDEANKAKAEALYKKYMDEGEKAASAKGYDDAIVQFTKALGVKQNDVVAQKRIDDMNKIKNDLFNMAKNQAAAKEKDAAYKEAIERGNSELSAGNFDPAINAYRDALRAKENDKYATDQIKRSIKLKAEAQEARKKMYADIIKKADEYFGGNNFVDAKELYERAQKLNSDDPYPPAQIEACIKMLNKLNKKDPNHYELVHSGTIVTGQGVLDGQRLLEEAKRQEKYEEEQNFVNINDKNQLYHKDHMSEDNKNSLSQQDEFDSNEFVREQLFKTKDEMRWYKVDSTREYIDVRNEAYRGALHQDAEFSYNRQQNFDQAEYDVEQFYKGKDKIREYNVDSVKFYKDLKDEQYRQSMKNNDDENYIKQGNFNEQEFYTEQLWKAKDGMREYKADSMKFYKDLKDDQYRQAMKNNDDENYIKQGNFNEQEFYTEQLWKAKDGMREYKADSVKFYKDLKDDQYRQAMKNNDDENYVKQANFNNAEFYTEQLWKTKDNMREYKADSVKFYKDLKDDQYRQAMKNNDQENYIKQGNFNEEEFYTEQLWKSKDGMREYKADSMKFYKDLKDEQYRQATKTNDEKNYYKQENFNDKEFANEQLWKQKDEIRQESVTEVRKNFDNRDAFVADVKKTNADGTSQNNDQIIRGEEKRYYTHKERSDDYLDGANDFKGINDNQKAKSDLYKKEGNERINEKNEEFKNTSPSIPKNYDTGHLAALAQDYGPGIHQWTTNKMDAKGKVTEIIVRRIVVKGTTANDYMMIQNRWGVNYTKNGQTIGDYVWTTETAGTIIEYSK